MLHLTSQWFSKNSYPLTVFLVSRAGIGILAYLSLIFIPIADGKGFWRAYPDCLLLDGLARWDSAWYASIAQNGYTNIAQLGEHRDTAFFPLYPLLIRILNTLVGDIHLAGILVSNISFFIAVVVLYKLVFAKYDEETARRTVALLAFNPFSIFFSAMYSESTFLLASVCVFYFGERKRWFFAGLSAAAAGATRAVGFLTTIALLLLYLEQIDFDWRKIRLNLAWAGAGLAGLGGYMLFLAMRFDDPLQFVRSQDVAGWGKGVTLQSAIETVKSFWPPAAILAGHIPALEILYLLVFAVSLMILALAAWRLPPAYTTWAAVTILASFSLWRSMGRFIIVVFPLYVAVVLLFGGKKFELVLCTSALFMGLFTIMFTHWYWLG